MKAQHPVPIWGFFLLVGLGAMIGPLSLFAGLLLGTVLGGMVEAYLAPSRPDAQFLLEHES